MQASQQVSLLTTRPTPGTAGSVRAFAGVAQLVEHLFCKQVVSGSIPLASSNSDLASVSSPSSSVSFTEIYSEGCPSGQREQAVNLPAHAYVGSNPTPSTRSKETRTARGFRLGMRSPLRGLRPSRCSAGVTQLVESQFSKLMVDGSSPFSRSTFLSVSSFSSLVSRVSRHQTASTSSQQQRRPDAGTRLKPARPASLVAGEAEARTGAERTLVREHRTTAEAQPAAKIAGRRYRSQQRTNAHLAQLVEHVLGKDEVTSSSLVVGSIEIRTVVTIPVRRESESNG